jgi:peptide deformylase
MALLRLHLLGSPVLRQRSDEVAAVDDEVRALIADMFETMDAAKGVGLAAPQIGIDWAAAVVCPPEGEPEVLLNPRIVGESVDHDEQYGRCCSPAGRRTTATTPPTSKR